MSGVLGSLAPARRRVVLGLVALVGLAALATGGLLVRAAVDDPEVVPQEDLGPVLLVTGYGGSTRALEPLAARLEDLGRVVEVVPPLDGGTGDLDAQAEALGEAATRALEDHDGPSVDVVGYSAGGVVARLWVREHGGDDLARRVLTIGSPHHGSDLAGLALDLGSCPTACRELAPGSDLLTRLNAGDETPPGPSWVSVWSDVDQVSAPPETARLDGALDLTVQSVCPGRRTSHGALPSDPVVLALLGTALGADAPAVPEVEDCA